jgi:uncharacterized protein YciI
LPVFLLLAMLGLGSVSQAQAGAPAPADKTDYDGALAKRLGANENGMRAYVLVILRAGLKPVPKGKARDVMFAGHFTNIARLAAAGKLVLAGPFGEHDGDWRGLFLLAVDDVAQARRLTATDPVIAQGEMIAEYHPWYGSAAAMMLPELHQRLVVPH